MHRTLLASVCLAGAAAGGPKFAFVSQSASGPFDSQTTILGVWNSTLSGTFNLDVHAELGSLRAHVFFADDNTTNTVILSSKAKVMYQDSTDGRGGRTCQYTELPHLPEPSQYLECAAGLLEKGKHWRNDKQGNAVYDVKDNFPATKLGPITIGGGGALSLHVDKAGAFKNSEIGGSFKILGFPVAFIAIEAPVVNSSLNPPKEDVFDLPSLDKCEKVDLDEDLSQLTKPERAWFKCFDPTLVQDADETLIV